MAEMIDNHPQCHKTRLGKHRYRNKFNSGRLVGQP